MSASTFWKAIILLTIVGSAYSGIQYYRNITQVRADLEDLQNQLALTRETLQQQKLDWNNIEALRSKATERLAKKPALTQKKEELEKKFRSLESEFKYLVTSTRDAVDKARQTAVGRTYPELKLTDGKILKDAKIRKLEERQISFIHADGIGSVPLEQLPEDIRAQYDMGNNGLAYQLATLEKNILSPSGEQEFEGLTLRCPFALAENNNAPVKMQAGGPMQSMRIYQHKSPEIEINVASIQYKENFVVGLDGAITGALQATMKLEGISKPVHQVHDQPLAGGIAKRLTFSANRFGDVLYMESVYVLRGQQLWFVQTVFSEKTKDSRPVAESILSSIGLKPAS